jgi:GT2 family glycosyltransferase
MSPPVHVVILNWNSTVDTLACVAAVERQDYPDCRIVVVDNGSEEAAIDPLRDAEGRFRLLRNARNLGFAGGCNVGLRHAMADGAGYIWLLNSDAIAPTDTLRKLVATAEAEPRIGLISPLLRDTEAPNDLAAFCGVFNTTALTYAYTDRIDTAVAWQADQPERVVLMGTALLIRRGVVDAIGELDEQLFAYWEDTDYSIRSSAAGFANRVDFHAAVLHPIKQTYSDSRAVSRHYSYYMARNEILLLRKHGSPLQRAKALRWRFLQQMQVIERLGSDDSAVQAVLAGVWDGWIGRGGEFDPGRRMPFPLCNLLARHPALARRIFGRGGD